MLTNSRRAILRFTGIVLILAGFFAGFPSPWPVVSGFLGLGMFLAAGGFG